MWQDWIQLGLISISNVIRAANGSDFIPSLPHSRMPITRFNPSSLYAWQNFVLEIIHFASAPTSTRNLGLAISLIHPASLYLIAFLSGPNFPWFPRRDSFPSVVLKPERHKTPVEYPHEQETTASDLSITDAEKRTKCCAEFSFCSRQRGFVADSLFDKSPLWTGTVRRATGCSCAASFALAPRQSDWLVGVTECQTHFH